MIELIIEPRVVKTWAQFCKESPPFSIALDGYVAGPPRYDPVGPRINENHHEGVVRKATRCTAAQVYVDLKKGLFKRFQKDGKPQAHVFLNDPDDDSSLSFYLIKRQDRVQGSASEPLINRLVFAVDMLDTTSGAFPFRCNSDLMRDIAWIFEPFSEVSKQVYKLGAAEMKSVVEAICGRIDAYAIGRGEQIAPDTRYEVLHRGDGWAMIREIGRYARVKLAESDEFDALIVVKDEAAESNVYSLFLLNPFTDKFSVDGLCAEFNRVEGIHVDAIDRWGGGDYTGGSPRKMGSKIKPGQLAAITEEFLHSRV